MAAAAILRLMTTDHQQEAHPFFRNIPTNTRKSSRRSGLAGLPSTAAELVNDDRPRKDGIHRPIDGQLDCSSIAQKNDYATPTSRIDLKLQPDPTRRPQRNCTHICSLSQDPDLNPRKRQKLDMAKTSPAQQDAENNVGLVKTTMETPATSWLTQLRQAAEIHPKAPEILNSSGQELQQSAAASGSVIRGSVMTNDDHIRPQAEEATLSPALLKSNALTEPTTPKKKKMLKLNPNGKLVTSPTSTRLRGHSDDRNFKAQWTRNPAGIATHTHITLQYGRDKLSRIEIGNKIDTILKGDTIVSRTSSMNSLPVEAKPEKPTHPFFLRKGMPRSSLTVEREESPGDRSVPDSLENPNPAKALRHVKDISESTKVPASRRLVSHPNVDVSHGRSIRYGHDLWPPKGMMHVTENPGSSAVPSKPFPVRKAKGMRSSVDAQEDILILLGTKLQCLSHAQDIDNFRPQRLPQAPSKLVCSGQELRDGLCKDHHLLGELRLLPDTRHAAKQRLIELLPTAMSTFDLWQYDNISWCSKYAPKSSGEVLQGGSEAALLRDWLKSLTVSAVDDGLQLSTQKTSSSRKSGEGRKKRKRKRADDLDGFLVSSEDESHELAPVEVLESELTSTNSQGGNTSMMRPSGIDCDSNTPRSQISNCILISGPHGCGKTASVYAAAKELGFEVFEMNPGSRRSGKDIFDRVGDVTQNHLVQKEPLLGPSMISQDNNSNASVREEVTAGKQGTMKSFFQSKTKDSGKLEHKPEKLKDEEHPAKNDKSRQKQSLILFEEVDVLYEDDKSFWSCVQAIIQQSKRPIVLTCTDESLVPLSDLSLQGILRYTPPPRDVTLDYLLLLALSEGHCLDRNCVSALFDAKCGDLRATITELDFWCQMAVGSREGGLDWMIERYPPGRDLDIQGRPLRSISCGTFTADLLTASNGDSTESANRTRHSRQEVIPLETTNAPEITLATLAEGDLPPKKSIQDSHSYLARLGEYCDAQSNLDLLLADTLEDSLRDNMDPSFPPLSSPQRLNYNEGYPLIHAGISVDYTGRRRLMGTVYRLQAHQLYYKWSADASLPVSPDWARFPSTLTHSARQQHFAETFYPLQAEDKPIFPPATGWLAPSLDRSAYIVALDIAPFVRSIVTFDIRLEQQREQLGQVSTDSRNGAKRVRTTRASHAALEGGNKASTRRVRWFPKALDYHKVLETGGRDWQEAALSYLIATPKAPIRSVDTEHEDGSL